MITTMREIYPDETIYSWFAWYHKISGNLLVKDTIFELLNFVTYGIPIQEFGFKSLCSNLPKTFNYNPEYLIRKHTLLPFFKPFMSNEKSKKYLEYMNSNKRLFISPLMKTSNINVKTEINICPECYKEDKKRYGEAYLHRIHQIFGYFVCDIHKVDLISIDYDNTFFIDLDDIEKELKVEKKFVNEKFINISNDLIKLLNNKNLYKKDFIQVKEIYKHRLIEKGYWHQDGQVYQKKLTHDFIEFHSHEFLNKLNSDLQYGYNWIKTMLKNKTNKLTHPVRHILLIEFLFGDIDGFENYQCIDFKPFGMGPWPCLNSCCSKYKEDSIYTCSIDKNAVKNYFTGTFKCPTCEFTYLRCSANSNKDKFKVGRVVSYGKSWDTKLIKIVTNKQSLREVARIMGCSRATIKTQLNRLNTNIGCSGQRNKKIQKIKYKNVEKLVERKVKILKLISKNPHIIRSTIRNILPKEYSYLYKNDIKWFEENLPKPVQKKEAMHKFYERYWVSIDNEISIKVINAIEKILGETPSIRVTKKYISKVINYQGVSKSSNLSKMPITKDIIDSKCESVEQFKHRIIEDRIKLMGLNTINF